MVLGRKLEDGRVLLAANSTYTVNSTGGAFEIALSAEQLPTHSHSATSAESGGHSHTRGSMDIWGNLSSIHSLKCGFGNAEGCLRTGAQKGASTAGDSGDAWNGNIEFLASLNWPGATSTAPNHTHSITIGSTGSGSAHSNMQPYRACYMWKRTA